MFNLGLTVIVSVQDRDYDRGASLLRSRCGEECCVTSLKAAAWETRQGQAFEPAFNQARLKALSYSASTLVLALGLLKTTKGCLS